MFLYKAAEKIDLKFFRPNMFLTAGDWHP